MNRLRRFLALSALLSLLLGFGCNPDNVEPTRILKYSALGPPPTLNFSVAEYSPNERHLSISASTPQAPRMIIKTASMSVEVADYEKAVQDIQKAVNQMRGFTVTSSTNYSGKDRKSGSMKIRIPSERFEGAVDAIVKASSHVFSKTISGNDVTEEFFDVNARLRNKRMVETRYREILGLAKSVKDILAVEESLGNVREEIEQLEGRRKFLSDQTALSTIDANLREPRAFVDAEQSFWNKVVSGFHQGGRNFGDVVSFMVTMLVAGFPVMIILLILGFVILRIIDLRKSGTRRAWK